MKIPSAMIFLASPWEQVVAFQGTSAYSSHTLFSNEKKLSNFAKVSPLTSLDRNHKFNKMELRSGESDMGEKEAGCFNEDSLDFTMGYLNKHHRDLLTTFAITFTQLGVVQKQRNAMSGGSYQIQNATIVGIQKNHFELDVEVQIRSEKEPRIERQTVNLDAVPQIYQYKDLPKVPVVEGASEIDNFVRKMNRLCLICKSPSTTGKLTQLGFKIGGDKTFLLKEDMYLNQIPHNRYVRKYFYDMASKAVLEAVIACSNGKFSNRMKVTSMFPEMNPSMDSYRIGTLLELVRTITITLVEQNLRVRICVQGSMGAGFFTGLPKQLSGVSALLQRMDWQSGEGEENEGMVGNFVNFGEIGREHVVNSGTDSEGNEVFQDDVFLLICPQSMIGVDTSIFPTLTEMTDAAGDRPIIIINPDLIDKVSPQGQQNIRGRQERLDFANSFKTIYHFQNIYVSGTSYFPILGAVNKPGYQMPWAAYQRRDWADEEGEVYVPMLSTEEQPDGEMITGTFN